MRTLQLTAIAAAAVISSLALVSCGGGSGSTTTTVVTPPVLQELQNARYVVSFVDTTTGAQITDPLKVSFVGTATLKAADGSSLNNQTVTTGAGSVFVNADFTSTANDFSVQVADGGNKGWIPTGTRVVGTAGLKGDQAVEIRMVNTKAAATLTASPDPVAMSVVSGTASATGALTAPVTVATAAKTVTNSEGQQETIGTSALKIDTGTIGKTASGAPAAPGPLTVANTYYSNANAESLTAFPGGFAAVVEVPAANVAVLNGVAPDAGSFITGGFAQFNVTDSAGNAIKNFDKPLSVGIDLPKGTLDENGVELVAGDQYPVWSYDDATGKWVFEKMGTVAEKNPVDPKNFTVQFTTTHLSSWNLDQFVNACSTAKVNLVGRPAGDNRALTVDLMGPPGNRFAKRLTVSDSALTLFNVPRINGTIVVKDGSTEVGRVTGKNFCTAAVDVPITLAPLPQGNVRIETFESCADGTKQRALAAATKVVYAASGKTVNLGGYSSQAVSTDTFAQKSFSSIPTGTVTVQAQNPRTGSWVAASEITGSATTSSVVTGGTTIFRFRFDMTCKVVSGGV